MIIDPEIRDLHVPWPSDWQHRQPSKSADVRKLEWATARELAEQDVWRDRLEALRQLGLAGDAIERLADYGVERLLRKMDEAGARYPPTWKDEQAWVEHQGEEWHWSKGMNHRRSSKIANKDVNSEVYWLLEYGQHKERIKAFVLFASILHVDPDSDEAHVVFTFWTLLNMHDVLKEAYGELSQP